MGSYQRMIRDKYNTDLKLDALEQALHVITASHYQIHEGESFLASKAAAANSSDTLEVYVKTPNSMKEIHMFFRLTGALETKFEIFEGTSKTYNASNKLTPYNRNRNSNTSSSITDADICHTPGGSGDGTSLISETIADGKFSGGTRDTGDEWILKRNTAYLIRLTSNANSNNLTVELDWYEERTETYTTTTTTTTTTTSSTTTTSP